MKSCIFNNCVISSIFGQVSDKKKKKIHLNFSKSVPEEKTEEIHVLYLICMKHKSCTLFNMHETILYESLIFIIAMASQ